jgi:nucleoside-diphosphate-sugar epimerase
MATYLVTGCAGFIGSHLVEALLDAGNGVIGIDRFAPSYERAHKARNLARARAGNTEMDVRPPARPGDVRVSQADVTRARERLDHVPNVELREGLRRTHEHMRAHPSLPPAIHERRRWIAQAT